MIFLSTSSLVVPLLLFVGVFLCLNFFVGRFCAVTFLVCVEFEVLLMPYSVVLGLSPFTVCLVLASSLLQQFLSYELVFEELFDEITCWD